MYMPPSRAPTLYSFSSSQIFSHSSGTWWGCFHSKGGPRLRLSRRSVASRGRRGLGSPWRSMQLFGHCHYRQSNRLQLERRSSMRRGHCGRLSPCPIMIYWALIESAICGPQEEFQIELRTQPDVHRIDSGRHSPLIPSRMSISFNPAQNGMPSCMHFMLIDSMGTTTRSASTRPTMHLVRSPPPPNWWVPVFILYHTMAQPRERTLDLMSAFGIDPNSFGDNL